MKNLPSLLLLILLAIYFFLHLNNINLYNPDFGFDGKDHQEYIQYIYDAKSLPLPHQGWEFNQPPLYYLLGAFFKFTAINPQFLNLLIFYLLIAVTFFFTRSKIALFALLSLPMINYFPALITNELLAGLFLVAGLLLLWRLKSLNPLLLVLILTAGFYAKYTILTLLPLIPLAYFLQTKSFSKTFKKTLLIYSIFFIAILPLLYRNFTHYGKPLVLATDFYQFNQPVIDKDINYFTRLDWISKADLFAAKNYSFTGGLWNTFWHDGEQVIVPVVNFHKKALVLWLVGFPLAALSLFGLYRHYLRNPRPAIILFTYIAIAFTALVLYNLALPYNFVSKSFYAFGLVVPYSIGLCQAAIGNEKARNLIIILLFVQFFTMLSYFWIQPSWHNVK